PFAVGLTGFSFRRFLAWSAPASLLWAAVFVTVYALAAAPLRRGEGSTLAVAGLAALGLLVFTLSAMLQRGWERVHPIEEGPISAVQHPVESWLSAATGSAAT